MAVVGIHHATLLVSDLARSLAFYRGLLGIPLDESRPDLGFDGVWLQVGAQQVHLMVLPNPDPLHGRPVHGGRDRHLALQVDDVNRLAERLESEGVVCSISKSGRPAFFCRDPDMNALEFLQG